MVLWLIRLLSNVLTSIKSVVFHGALPQSLPPKTTLKEDVGTLRLCVHLGHPPPPLLTGASHGDGGEALVTALLEL